MQGNKVVTVNLKKKGADMYLVTRQFVGGTLKGQVHTEVTSVRWTVGTVVSNPVGGSPYKIISVGVDDPAADGRRALRESGE